MKPVLMTMAVVALAGCAGDSAAPAATDVAPGHSLQVDIGAVKELCFEAVTGDLVTYRFESDGPLEFNLHYHVDSEVYYPVPAHTVVAAEKRQYRIPADQSYCLMWTNNGDAPVNLNADIDGAGDIKVY